MTLTASVPETAIANYRRDGFLLGPQILDAAAIDRLQREVLRVIDERDGPGPQPVLLRNIGPGDERPIWQIVNIHQASEAFRHLLAHPLILEWAAALTGARSLQLWHDQIQYKPAGEGGNGNWHQDAPLWPVLEPQDGMISAWVALDDADVDNGCMHMVPGSHRWGDHIEHLRGSTGFADLPPLPGHDRPRTVPRRVGAGRVHFHHSLTWHGSPANTSGRPRRAIAIHYLDERVRFQPRGRHHIMATVHEGAEGEVLRGHPFPVLWRA